METQKDNLNSLEIKIKLLEIENQQLKSTIESKNKEIEQLKSLIKSLIPNINLSPNFDDKIINLNFGWKINDNATITNDLKIIRKISGGEMWNCSAFGDKSLIKGKINKFKIQLTKMTSYIVFGIIPKGININGINNWKKGYITCSSNFAKHNLGMVTDFANQKATEGNIIEIIADLDRGELSFSLNGNNLGIFCDNIIKDIEYVPFVDIQKEESEIRLL
jgi:mRNA-degrading endonuclease YafQ of YafQ-DinJ toxin-antitoxin module